jgi:hypothetical protein
VELDPGQELAAVSSFLASLSQNVIPSYVDPWKPIDPQLVLDFDTGSPRATEELRAMVNDVWARNPVFLYSKVCSLPPQYISFMPNLLVKNTAVLSRLPRTQSHTSRHASKSRTYNHRCGHPR